MLEQNPLQKIKVSSFFQNTMMLTLLFLGFFTACSDAVAPTEETEDAGMGLKSPKVNAPLNLSENLLKITLLHVLSMKKKWKMYLRILQWMICYMWMMIF